MKDCDFRMIDESIHTTMNKAQALFFHPRPAFGRTLSPRTKRGLASEVNRCRFAFKD